MKYACYLLVLLLSVTPTALALDQNQGFSCGNVTDRKIALSTLCQGCALEITESLSIPKESDQLLKLKKPGGDLVIRGPEDLRGSVHLRNEKEVVEYLRLFSSACTAHLFDDMKIELSQSTGESCDGPCLPEDRWKALELHTPKIETGDDYFDVTRIVAVPIPNILHTSLRRLTERVYSDGEVITRTSFPIEITLADQATLMFPIYM